MSTARQTDNGNQELLIHVVNVDHGDAIIIEIPTFTGDGGCAHFGIVDAGRPERRYRDRLSAYLNARIDQRGCGKNFKIDFVCISHPHEDHYGGLQTLFDDERLAAQIKQFWDCGFRTTAVTYNKLLKRIADSPNIVYDRVASGFECEIGNIRIDVLAPSIDLRNRFDTFGVDRNNASVVLRIQYGYSIAILAGDAFLDSWGKVAEEFPRTSRTAFAKGARPLRAEGVNQLNCQLLKASHHGSKHGTSLEFVEKLTPKYVMFTCARPQWYQDNEPRWPDQWPHPLTRKILGALHSQPRVHSSGKDGNVVYHLTGKYNNRVYPRCFKAAPDDTSAFDRGLKRAAAPLNASR